MHKTKSDVWSLKEVQICDKKVCLCNDKNYFGRKPKDLVNLTDKRQLADKKQNSDKRLLPDSFVAEEIDNRINEKVERTMDFK